jgi:tRNA(Ile)-lysidine synthase TilS/MesJ
MKHRLIEKFCEFSNEHSLFEKNKKYSIFFSGGMDSTFLLLMIFELQKRISFEFEVLLIKTPLILYSGIEFESISKYWQSKSLVIRAIVPNNKSMLDEECTICKKFRVDETFHYIQEKNTANIVAAFTLDELVYYFLQVCLKTNMPYSRKLRRLLRFLPKKNFTFEEISKTIIYPLLDFSGVEIRNYLNEVNVPYLIQQCPKANTNEMFTCFTGQHKYQFLYGLIENDILKINFKYLSNWFLNNYPEVVDLDDLNYVFTSNF